jgi:hypothetical protein
MMKDRKYRMSAQQSMGCREEEPSCQQRRTRTLCAGSEVSGRKAMSALSMSCWHPTMSTTAQGFLTSQRARRGSKRS